MTSAQIAMLSPGLSSYRPPQNFPPHVVDKVLNHSNGTIRGVAAVYNRFEYLEERRAALEAWGQHIQKIVVPQPSNMIAIVRR